MVDVRIVNETSPEANWNRQTDRQTGKPMCREAAPPKIIVQKRAQTVFEMTANDQKCSTEFGCTTCMHATQTP